MKLLDGDFISALNTKAITKILSLLSKDLLIKFKESIKMGIICTAYSNGAFMKLMESEYKDIFTLEIAKTGVKFLKQAAEKYDIAVEYEANGHGKVSVSDLLSVKISSLISYCMSSSDILLLELLNSFLALFNPTVGDSITVMLSVECSLKLLNYSIIDWTNIYSPLLFVYGKLVVKNKADFECIDNETMLIKPNKLQVFIDDIVCDSNKNNFDSRCFVRPSGTEDVVRIYSESKDIIEAKRILGLVEDYIKNNYV